MFDESDPETPSGYYDGNNIAEDIDAPEITKGEYAENLNKIFTTLDVYQTDINGIKNKLKSMRMDVIGLTDITVEQFYHINAVFRDLKTRLG